MKRRTWILLLCALATLCGELGFSGDQEQAAKGEKASAVNRVQVSAFSIIGIESRTNNARESNGNGMIPQLWQRFFSEDIPGQIPNTTSGKFYAVYTDYASDHNGDYTYIVGAPVKEGTAPPKGMVLKLVPAGEYAVFTTEKGLIGKVIRAAWQSIFQLEDQGKLKRTYQTDFEVFDERAQDPQNAQVDIYIGVK